MATEESDHYQVRQLVSKLNRLVGIDPAAIERIARAVDQELTNAKATAKSLSAAELSICKGSGTDPDTLAAWKATDAANERIVLGIPKDQLMIMKIMYGDNNAVLAARYTDLQGQIREGKVAK